MSLADLPPPDLAVFSDADEDTDTYADETDDSSAIATAAGAPVVSFSLPPPPPSQTIPTPSNRNPNPNPDNGNSTGAIVPASSDESRRLFQRLWTDEEELVILRGFLEFTSKRGTTFASHQYDTGPFYDEIKRKFSFDFSKNQLIEKLRRLKKKYRTCALRMQNTTKEFSFRSAHEQAIYEVARHIWRLELKRDRDSDEEYADLNPNSLTSPNRNSLPTNPNLTEPIPVTPTEEPRSKRRVRRKPAEITPEPLAIPLTTGTEAGTTVPVTTEPVTTVPVTVTVENSIPDSNPTTNHALTPQPGMIEETVKNCLSPLFKELIGTAMNGLSPLGQAGGGVLGLGLGLMNPWPLKIEGIGGGDEKWRRQQIMELEVYLHRIELLHDQVKSTLEQLRSGGS